MIKAVNQSQTLSERPDLSRQSGVEPWREANLKLKRVSATYAGILNQTTVCLDVKNGLI